MGFRYDETEKLMVDIEKLQDELAISKGREKAYLDLIEMLIEERLLESPASVSDHPNLIVRELAKRLTEEKIKARGKK